MTLLPNTFQTPNEYVDALMVYLTPQEYVCLSFATRHILGWQEKLNSRHGKISLTMFEHGYTTPSGTQFGGTGLSRPAILKATTALDEFGILVKLGEPTQDGQEWELGTVIQWDALTQRKDAERAANVQRTTAARAKKVVSPTNHSGGQSDLPPVVSPTNRRRSVPLTESKPSSKPSSKPIAPAREDKDAITKRDYEDVPHATRLGILNAWCSNLKAQPVGAFNERFAKGRENHATAAELHRAGYTEFHVEAFVQAAMTDAFWDGKTLTLQKVAELLPSYVAKQKVVTPPTDYFSAPLQPAADTTPEERAALIRESRKAVRAVMV